MSRITVVGDVLLDRDIEGSAQRLAPDAPVPVVDEERVLLRAGGAGLAAALAARDGHDVTLVTSTGDDGAGAIVKCLLAAQRVRVVDLGSDGDTAEKVRVFAGDHALVRIDRGARVGNVGALDDEGRAALDAEAILVSDYGRGVAGAADVRAALVDVSHRAPVVWDPHPRGAAPIAGMRLVTPNRAEAAHFARALSASSDDPAACAVSDTRAPRDHDGTAGEPHGTARSAGERFGATERDGTARIASDVAGIGSEPHGATRTASDSRATRANSDVAMAARRCRALVEWWRADAVVVKLGPLGAVVVEGRGWPLVVPAIASVHGDPCGAGDRFAATVTAAVATGLGVAAAVELAVRAASEFVARGGARAAFGLDRVVAELAGGVDDVIARVRARGGTVVATGGCFDVLHAGHVRMLRSARSLGDCLIVCLNSDASVRRLKGEGRPIHCVEDRSAVLSALSFVDAVVVFDDDAPTRVLERLRPDVWVKAADYADRAMPEAAVLGAGEAVLVPHLAGRSTTRILKEVKP